MNRETIFVIFLGLVASNCLRAQNVPSTGPTRPNRNQNNGTGDNGGNGKRKHLQIEQYCRSNLCFLCELLFKNPRAARLSMLCRFVAAR